MPDKNSTETGQVQMEWEDVTRLPIFVGDVLHWRVGADRCYLTVGQFNLPIVDGQIPEGFVVPVRPVVRLMVTPDTLPIWSSLLAQAASNFKNLNTPGVKK